MDILSTFSLLLLVATVTMNVLFAIAAYRSDRKSTTNIIFVILNIIVSLWLAVMYVSLQSQFITTSLLWIRLSMVLAAPMTMFFFLFSHTVPLPRLRLRRPLVWLVIATTAGVMAVMLSSYGFSDVYIENGLVKPTAGPGIPFFGFFVLLMTFLSIYTLQRRKRTVAPEEQRQLHQIILGILLMYGLMIFTVFLPVTVFEFTLFVPLFPLYALCFTSMTAYAIIKHHLFNLKVITTQAFTIIIWIVLFSQIFIAQTLNERLVDIAVLIISIPFGFLLVRSVQKEVQQRELLQKLTEELKVSNDKLEVANARLKELDQAKTEFLSITSHQLRTPMTGIKGYLSMVLDGDYGKLAKPQADAIKIVTAEVDRLSRLVQVFLNVSRIESGRLLISKSSFNLNDLVASVVKELELVAEAKGVSVKHENPSNAIEIMGDRDKLNDVVINLVDNAIKYTPAGAVSVEAVSDKDGVGIDVRDTGVGIDPEEAKRLFEKFSRGRGAAEAAPGGTGLGLFIVKKIVEAHGGRVWARSPGRGKGSVFSFRIPLTPSER